MKITIESTTKIVGLELPNGAVICARVWEGTTASGIPVHCYIPRIAVDARNRQDHSEFERDLLEQKTPSAAIADIPLRLLID